MAVTLEQVKQALSAIEPNYPELARLGPEALPHLRTLVAGADPGLASKAAYLASLIRDGSSAEIVAQAAGSRQVEVRVAAAAAAKNLPPPEASRLLTRLVGDTDVGVRKTALKSVPAAATPELRRRVEALARADAEPALRQLSTETLRRMSPGT